MTFRQKAVIFFATGFHIGNAPFAPGTLGTILGLTVCFLLSKLDLYIAAPCAVLFVLFAVWIAHHAELILNKKDPGCIVIDEIAGIVIALLGLPFNLVLGVTGFFLFRLLDILKPFPIRYLEKKISGGAGIVLDDVMAGAICNIVLRVLFFVNFM
jgi:phosphatidylglycerophosphatase A